jgi:hypothetical protein
MPAHPILRLYDRPTRRRRRVGLVIVPLGALLLGAIVTAWALSLLPGSAAVGGALLALALAAFGIGLGGRRGTWIDLDPASGMARCVRGGGDSLTTTIDALGPLLVRQESSVDTGEGVRLGVCHVVRFAALPDLDLFVSTDPRAASRFHAALDRRLERRAGTSGGRAAPRR